MATDCWPLGDGRWALYTEDQSLDRLAVRAGLRLMGIYYDRNGNLKAKQFAGPERAVKGLARLGSGGKDARGTAQPRG